MLPASPPHEISAGCALLGDEAFALQSPKIFDLVTKRNYELLATFLLRADAERPRAQLRDLLLVDTDGPLVGRAAHLKSLVLHADRVADAIVLERLLQLTRINDPSIQLEKLTGGKYGQGSRMPIRATRALLDAALSGTLKGQPMRRDPLFGFGLDADDLAAEQVADAVLAQQASDRGRVVGHLPLCLHDPGEVLARLGRQLLRLDVGTLQRDGVQLLALRLVELGWTAGVGPVLETGDTFGVVTHNRILESLTAHVGEPRGFGSRHAFDSIGNGLHAHVLAPRLGRESGLSKLLRRQFRADQNALGHGGVSSGGCVLARIDSRLRR